MLDALTQSAAGHIGIMFNISKHVGVGQSNDSLDAMLVQFGYCAMGKYHGNEITPELRSLCNQLNAGAPYNGRPDELLSRVIITHQRMRGGKQDGYVSRMHGGSLHGIGYSFGGGVQSYILSALVGNMRRLYIDVWPRIDRTPDCPPPLASAIKGMF